jgi:hypothetical protein
MISFWVWNINKEVKNEFINFIKRKKVDKILLNVDCPIKPCSYTPLIGDSKNELSVNDVLKKCEPYDKVHLDIELAAGENRQSFYRKLSMIIERLKIHGKYVEVDVETWNLD